MTTKLSYKNYLYNNAKLKAEQFNKIVNSINEVVGVTLNATQLEQLNGLFCDLSARCEIAEVAWDRYATYCEQNKYKIKVIEYATYAQLTY